MTCFDNATTFTNVEQVHCTEKTLEFCPTAYLSRQSGFLCIFASTRNSTTVLPLYYTKEQNFLCYTLFPTYLRNVSKVCVYCTCGAGLNCFLEIGRLRGLQFHVDR